MPPAVLGAVAVGVAGLGVGLLGSMLLAPKTPDYSGMMSQMQNQAVANPIAESMPELPEDPNKVVGETVDPVTGETVVETANPEADKAAQQLAAQAAATEEEYNPTGGLGIQSNAVGRRKSLGGF